MKWRSFRDSEDSRYVGLTLPHVLMREPYGAATKPTESFRFEEDVDGRDHKNTCGATLPMLSARLTEAFSMHGWCVAIRGVEGGGLVQGLPTHQFETDEGEVAMKCPTEVAITDRRERNLPTTGSFHWFTVKEPTMQHFLRHNRLTKQRNMTLTQPMQTQGFPASCSTSLPYPDLLITSSR